MEGSENKLFMKLSFLLFLAKNIKFGVSFIDSFLKRGVLSFIWDFHA
jgi:hypothetical protein